MNKKILKSIIMIATILITMLILTTVSNAALSISTSKSTVEPGESFSVTVSVSSNEAGDIYLSANNGTLSQTHIDLMSQASVTVNCVAGSSGTVSISASGTVANYTTETEGPQSASKSVTIEQPAPPTPPPSDNSGSSGTSSNNNRPSNNTRPTETTPTESSNSKLASLAITEGVITPEFNSDVTEYSISVPNEITVLNISATAEDSAAEVEIVGNEELKAGENNIQIIVTAEDGSTTTYNILATRADEELSLQSLSIYYIDENGQKVELKLNPIFALNVYEYNILEKLPSTVNKLEVEAIASKENAKIEITGNEELKSGQNEISIKVTLTDEAGLEEQKTYKIILEKEEEPVGALTFWEKMSRWFNGAGITISTWFSQNLQKIIIGMLIVATVTFMGLTVYFVYDYKNYKKLLSKLAEYNKENLMERASTALNPEMIEDNEGNNIENNSENITDINKEDNADNNIVEQIYNAENPETGENVQEITEKPKTKLGKGKRFK